MKTLISNLNWKKVYYIVAFSLIMFHTFYSIFHFILPESWKVYWIFIPLSFYLLILFFEKAIKSLFAKSPIREIIIFLSMAAFYGSTKCALVNSLYQTRFGAISFVFVCNLLVSIILLNFNWASDPETENNENESVFNLFYLNTSKAHEIAMLIDNKIMKAIEKEQISDELLKTTSSIGVNKDTIGSAEIGYSVEESTKKRVYENFDVKTTKSIMLRKIYDRARNKGRDNFSPGDLVLFGNIELEQINVDDIVMLLSVLQDSKIKNQGNDSLEINMNKMMDKMLDDFTIDYSFEYGETEKKKYIIRLPYKSTQYFENGYQHNDLQLGKLSLIGIYRGEIDFSKRESISSRFIELLSDSYYQGSSENSDLSMKLSYTGAKVNSNIPFNFQHKKITDKRHLIDVIAIIQELNLHEEKK